MGQTKFPPSAFLKITPLIAALFVIAGGVGPGLDGSLLEPEPALAEDAGEPRCIRCDPPTIESYTWQEIVQMWKEGILPCGHEDFGSFLATGVKVDAKADLDGAGAPESSRDGITLFPSVFDHQIGDELYFRTTVPGWVPTPATAFAISCLYYCMDDTQSGPVSSFSMSALEVSQVEQEIAVCDRLGLTWRECHSDPYLPYTSEVTVNYVPSCRIESRELVRVEVGDVIKIEEIQ